MFLLPAGGAALAPARADDLLTVTYMRLESGRQDYPLALMRLALEKSGRPFALSPSPFQVSQSRAIEQLGAGEISVGWFGTSEQLETRLRPIRIPIERGLLGYRLFLIDRARQPAFAAVQDLADLRRFSAGQGLGWSDIAILRAAGFKVWESAYENLFRMVTGHRIDFFPRGANEAFAELRRYGTEYNGLSVEQTLMLVYPFASFFFVARDDQRLAATLTQGLEAAERDGSFLQLFLSHPENRDVLELAHIERRRRIDIPNPTLTPDSRAAIEQWAWRPDQILTR